jgi:hypothetical protein
VPLLEIGVSKYQNCLHSEHFASYAMSCHCLLQSGFLDTLTEIIILGSMVRSMWWLLLWRWKSCVHCKWLAHFTPDGLFEGILSWQWFHVICPFCSRNTQYSTSGKIAFTSITVSYISFDVAITDVYFVVSSHSCPYPTGNFSAQSTLRRTTTLHLHIWRML